MIQCNPYRGCWRDGVIHDVFTLFGSVVSVASRLRTRSNNVKVAASQRTRTRRRAAQRSPALNTRRYDIAGYTAVAIECTSRRGPGGLSQKGDGCPASTFHGVKLTVAV